MELMTLDDFPTWSVYPLFILALAGAIAAGFILFRSLQRGVHRQSVGRRASGFSGSALLFLVLSGLVLWFLTTSMFERFHSMIIESDRIEFTYFWPQTPVIIRRADLVEVKIIPAHRTCGHMLVATRENVFRSVNFKKCAVAEQIVAKLSRTV